MLDPLSYILRYTRIIMHESVFCHLEYMKLRLCVLNHNRDITAHLRALCAFQYVWIVV